MFLLPGMLSVQAAEVLPETGTISYTGASTNIELADVNVGSDGKVYITDRFNGEAIIFNPLTREYKVFLLGITGDTGDVQPAPDGRVWYTDNKDLLGVFDPTNCSGLYGLCSGKIWQFPELGTELDKINIGSIAFDDQGRVWVGDYAGTITRLYRADQIGDNLEYCPYDIGFYHTHDLKFRDGAVWFGDYANHRIQRFELTETNTGYLSYWPLPTDADPDGIVFDTSGGLWWSEINAGRIGHLTFGATNTLTYYEIPGTVQPVAISIQSGEVWYSDHNGKVGHLNPVTAIPYSSTTISESTQSAEDVICQTFSPSLPESGYYFETKTLNFTAFDPLLIPDNSTPGWTIYTLPAGSIPAGMAAVGNQVYVADSNASVANSGKLIRFTIPEGQYKVFLPLILR